MGGCLRKKASLNFLQIYTEFFTISIFVPNLIFFFFFFFRIHVERAIERLRRFGVMKYVRHDMQKHFNKLVVILCFTVNSFGPLIKEKDLDKLGKKINEAVIDEDKDEDEIDEEFETLLSHFQSGLEDDEI